jgi:hypothetical protein
MTRRRKQFLIAVLVAFEILVCGAMFGSLRFAKMPRPQANTRFFYFATVRAEERIEERFAARGAGPSVLDLSNTRGDVQIAGSDGDEFVVVATKEAWGQGRADAQRKVKALQVHMESKGNTLYVRVVDPEDEVVQILVGSDPGSRVHFEITVPRRTSVVAHTNYSEIELRDTEGDAELFSRYDDILVEDVLGSVSVETNNGAVSVYRVGGEGEAIELNSRYGDVTVEDAIGKVTVETNNGTVEVHRVGGREAQVSAENRYGSITVEDVAGPVMASTNNGDVTVRNAGGEGTVIEVSTQYNDITLEQVTAADLQIECGNGDLKLDQVTVAGDIELDMRYVDIEMDNVRAKSLAIEGHNGKIALDDVELDGPLDIYAQYGEVDVTSTEASEYRVETHNAAITLDGAHGMLYLHTSYGDISIENAYDATLDLNARNGKVSFDGALSRKADHSVESEYGDVLLRLPSDTAVYLDARTRYGDIHCDFDVLVKREGGQAGESSNEDNLRGTINDGDALLSIDAHNGSITIESTH